MKTFSNIVIGLVLFACTSCNKQGDQGPQGATGKQGSQGASLSTFYPIEGQIGINGFTKVGTIWVYSRRLPTLDNSASNLVDVTYTIDNTGNSKAVYYTMPATDVFKAGDELYATFGHDTLNINYTGAAQPAYRIYFVADVIPQP